MLPKMICFDMDGTLADLYNVPNWLEQLRAFDPAPYREAECMWDEEELACILNTLIDNGVEIRIITWLSKESTPEYDEAVREAKREWLEALGIPYTHFHGVKYGATKADSIRRYLEEDETACSLMTMKRFARAGTWAKRLTRPRLIFLNYCMRSWIERIQVNSKKF